MRFFQEILAMALSKEDVHVVFPNLNLSLTTLVEMECYQALLQIKAAIEDDSLGDFECVEKIVCVLEEFGSDGGNRHDFG